MPAELVTFWCVRRCVTFDSARFPATCFLDTAVSKKVAGVLEELHKPKGSFSIRFSCYFIDCGCLPDLCAERLHQPWRHALESGHLSCVVRQFVW